MLPMGFLQTLDALLIANLLTINSMEIRRERKELCRGAMKFPEVTSSNFGTAAQG